jgi:hypothetical protein
VAVAGAVSQTLAQEIGAPTTAAFASTAAQVAIQQALAPIRGPAQWLVFIPAGLAALDGVVESKTTRKQIGARVLVTGALGGIALLVGKLVR